MMEREVINNRLREVIDFEIDYERKALRKELKEKDEELTKKNNELSKKDSELTKKNNENKKLKAILNQHNIDF